MEATAFPIINHIKNHNILILKIMSTPNFALKNASRYFVFGIVIPLIFVAYLTYRAHTASDYKQVSNLVKFVMLTGTLYSLVFLFLSNTTRLQ